MHTLVLVKDSCEPFSFGLGANGQLGSDSTSNSLKPSPLRGRCWTVPVIGATLSNEHLTDGTPVDRQVLRGIFAGGDQSFATVHVHVDFQERMVSQAIVT